MATEPCKVVDMRGGLIGAAQNLLGKIWKKQFPGERGGGLNRVKVGMERKYVKIYTRSGN